MPQRGLTPTGVRARVNHYLLPGQRFKTAPRHDSTNGQPLGACTGVWPMPKQRAGTGESTALLLRPSPRLRTGSWRRGPAWVSAASREPHQPPLVGLSPLSAEKRSACRQSGLNGCRHFCAAVAHSCSCSPPCVAAPQRVNISQLLSCSTEKCNSVTSTYCSTETTNESNPAKAPQSRCAPNNAEEFQQLIPTAPTKTQPRQPGTDQFNFLTKTFNSVKCVTRVTFPCANSWANSAPGT